MSSHVTQNELEDRIHKALESRVLKKTDYMSKILLEYDSCSAQDASLSLKHTVQEEEVNQWGTLHGGITAWLIDSTMGMISRAYTGYTKTVTQDIHVNFLRPIHRDAKMVITAQVTHAGKQSVNIQADVLSEGRLCATASSIFYRV